MAQPFRSAMCMLAVVLFAGAAAWGAPQGKQQQKCINKVNKAATKVQAAQGKVNAGCIKDFVKGTLTGPNAAENCLLDDVKDKVEAKQQNVVDDASKNCLAGQLPDFGYTSGSVASTVPYQAEVDLIHDVYGNPVDGGLYLCDTYPNECLCQRQVIDRVEKLFRAMSKIWLKCKNPALAIGKEPFPLGAASGADLAQCLTSGTIELSVLYDRKGKLANGTQQLGDTIANFCGKGANDEFGGGLCAGLSGAPLVDCFRNRVECRFCRMVNAVDGLAIDCAAWSGSASCP